MTVINQRLTGPFCHHSLCVCDNSAMSALPAPISCQILRNLLAKDQDRITSTQPYTTYLLKQHPGLNKNIYITV